MICPEALFREGYQGSPEGKTSDGKEGKEVKEGISAIKAE
jgi:hypothetical protein